MCTGQRFVPTLKLAITSLQRPKKKLDIIFFWALEPLRLHRLEIFFSNVHRSKICLYPKDSHYIITTAREKIGHNFFLRHRTIATTLFFGFCPYNFTTLLRICPYNLTSSQPYLEFALTTLQPYNITSFHNQVYLCKVVRANLKLITSKCATYRL